MNNMKKIIFFLAFLSLTSLSFANSSIDEKKNQINRIDREIKRSNEEIKMNTEKIKTLDQKTETLREQIARLEKELNIIDEEKNNLKDKIQVVSRKIDYGKRNLNFSSKELSTVQNDYIALLQAYQRSHIQEDSDIYNFKKILDSNTKRQQEIKSVQHNITKVKTDIEKEQRNLRGLQRELASKERQQVSKKQEQNNLIAQYNKDKTATAARTTQVKSSISSLQKQKIAIEKEINNIIKTRTKQLGNVKYSVVARNLGSFKRPITGRTVVGFNQRKTGGVRSSGQEISGSLGDVVVAANKGKVIYSGKFMNMGNVVMIDHGYNLITIYGNLISSHVRLNQRVHKGQDIGVLGLNLQGRSYLYYETRFNLKSSNPNNF